MSAIKTVYTMEKIEQMVKMYEAGGETVRSIAEKLGASQSTVQRLLGEYGNYQIKQKVIKETVKQHTWDFSGDNVTVRD